MAEPAARFAVVGAGYVGLTTAACLADLGHYVRVVDVDPLKTTVLETGVPFHELGLSSLVQRASSRGRLRFTSRFDDALEGADFALIAVGTPPAPNGSCDASAVLAAARSIGRASSAPLIVVIKSTVPVGTGAAVAAILSSEGSGHHMQVISNPEFLREGSAVHDFMHPERIIIGTSSHQAAERLTAAYAVLGAPVHLTDMCSAEMIKYASNAFLATKISFINEIAQLCDDLGADVDSVAFGMGMDTRIGPAFLGAGIGFGGSCFPKDVRALIADARRVGSRARVLEAVLAVNGAQRCAVIDRLIACLGSVDGRTITLLGAAFKPNTDDIRDAPAVDIAQMLLSFGAWVRIYDPVAGGRVAAALPEVEIAADAYAAVAGADAVVLVTEWDEFRELDLARVRASMKEPILIDGRNVYDPLLMFNLGFRYSSIGRPTMEGPGPRISADRARAPSSLAVRRDRAHPGSPAVAGGGELAGSAGHTVRSA